jgi:hypothetical protein
MKTTIRFNETQRFKQWWLWLILIVISAGTVTSLIIQLVYQQPVGDHPLSDAGLILMSVFIILLNILFFTFKFETIIDSDGIQVRFFPFHIKFRTYRWEDIEECYTRVYSPIREYGGWGLRGWGSDRALNVSGNKGIQLKFKNGNKLLIGTQSPELADEVIAELFKS